MEDGAGLKKDQPAQKKTCTGCPDNALFVNGHESSIHPPDMKMITSPFGKGGLRGIFQVDSL
jgi:hypothetical protein